MMRSLDSHPIHHLLYVGVVTILAVLCPKAACGSQPNIILVMADDQGWGQTGYYSHPVLKTPNLDAMAAAGLRMDRFYAGAPVCSPTRGSVLTGRANDRIGVYSHGHALRLQEVTIAQVLKSRGYTTGHFGKWHLNAMRGPGVPILKSDDHNPSAFGFDQWVSVTNFFDRDPLMSRTGKFESFTGDSSEVTVDLALDFIRRQVRASQPFFAVIWYGTPHSPFRAGDEDREPFSELAEPSSHHYGELVAMDRSIGALRSELRNLEIADDTLVWFCSDNGGLPGIEPETVGGLRGNKGTIYEGGLRVPGIIEWPSVIKPRVTEFPASVLDIFPTLTDVTQSKHPHPSRPSDGMSLKLLLEREIGPRTKAIPFRHNGRAALVDNRYKLLTQKIAHGKFELYDLESDPKESRDLSAELPDVFNRMKGELVQWSKSVDRSDQGLDYPQGKVREDEPEPRFWTEVEEYRPYFDDWKNRWEYASRLKPREKKPKKASKKTAAKP